MSLRYFHIDIFDIFFHLIFIFSPLLIFHFRFLSRLPPFSLLSIISSSISSGRGLRFSSLIADDAAFSPLIAFFLLSFAFFSIAFAIFHYYWLFRLMPDYAATLSLLRCLCYAIVAERFRRYVMLHLMFLYFDAIIIIYYAITLFAFLCCHAIAIAGFAISLISLFIFIDEYFFHCHWPHFHWYFHWYIIFMLMEYYTLPLLRFHYFRHADTLLPWRYAYCFSAAIPLLLSMPLIDTLLATAPWLIWCHWLFFFFFLHY